jgi:glycosyltransferase involved in cell wall biosynthesis
VTPLVSILVSNYNYGDFVAEAIESALAQTYTNCEIIVVDDGSTDSSRETINQFAGRIIPVFKSNGGQASAFNESFARARGNIISFLDSDDLFLPTKVEQVVHALDAHPREWCFHHLQWTDRDLNPVEMPVNPYKTGDRDLRSNVLSFTPPATSGLAFTRRLLEQILPMPESIRITSDNYLKLSAMALAPGYYIEEQLVLQRIHGNNLYTGLDNLKIRADAQIATALGLRSNFPALRRVCNRMYADGLAMELTLGRGDGGWTSHFEGMSLTERAALCARVTYKLTRNRLKQRAKATA